MQIHWNNTNVILKRCIKLMKIELYSSDPTFLPPKFSNWTVSNNLRKAVDILFFLKKVDCVGTPSSQFQRLKLAETEYLTSF